MASTPGGARVARVARRLEAAIALSPADVDAARETLPDLAGCAGFRRSGSAAGRNIDRLYVEGRWF